VLFAQRALLVEGYGDRVAALLVAEKLGLDLDAEGVTIVDCGGKSGVELVLGVCQALSIQTVVLHDEDLWPTDGLVDAKEKAQRTAENEAEKDKNDRIQRAAGAARVFVVRPSLEEVLGIGRNASDKPRRIAEAVASIDIKAAPHGLEPLLEAVQSVRGSAGP
jgi:predicted ATP-dependent endonuclease of OLD family